MNAALSSNIYVLRGLAAIFIMIYHYSCHYNTYIQTFNFKYFDFAWLTFAVPLFFIFSALFLYRKAIQVQHSVYLIFHRLIRLYPMYWIGVIFSSICILIAGEHLSMKSILFNLTMIEKVFGIEHIDGVYWTMFYELMLLVILSVMSLSMHKNYKLLLYPFRLCSIWLSLGCLSCLFMQIMDIHSSTVACLLFTCRYVPVFVVGILFYERFLATKSSISNKQFFLLLSVCVLYELLLTPSFSFGLLNITAILIAYAAFRGLFINLWFFKNKLLVSIGKASYAIYLCHNQFGRVLIKSLSDHTGGGTAICAIILTGLVAICIGFLFSKLEKPLCHVLISGMNLIIPCRHIG